MQTVLKTPTAQAFTLELLGRCRSYAIQTPVRSFRFGHTTLNVVFVGNTNPGFFTNAIAHREIARVEAELTVFVIDYRTSNLMLPPPCWDWQQADGHGTIHGLDEGYRGYFQQDTGVFTWVAYQEQVAIVWGTDLTTLPEWERSFPFRYVLHKWLERTSQYVLVHAGAVGTSTGGILLTGAGGSGKSTSTLACINTELRYAGDDFVLVDLELATVHSLYNVAKLNLDNISRFPHLQTLVTNPEATPDQKLQVYVHQHYPDAVTAGFPLKAIMLPRFTGAVNTTVRAATAAEALKALAPSTLALLRADQRTFQKMSRLIHQLPLFWLETGTDLRQIPAVILHTLQSLSNHESATR